MIYCKGYQRRTISNRVDASTLSFADSITEGYPTNNMRRIAESVIPTLKIISNSNSIQPV
jgi:hypothetical protein